MEYLPPTPPALISEFPSWPRGDNAIDRIRDGMIISGCGYYDQSDRQVELLLTVLRMNNASFVLYFGPKNTKAGFSEVVRRALLQFPEVAIVVCGSNAWRDLHWLTVGQLNQIADIPSDGIDGGYYDPIDVYIIRR